LYGKTSKVWMRLLELIPHTKIKLSFNYRNNCLQ
jgi:hypothetical protein